MPRPGPRPYECIRRAWHSERHQPIRGLIIQQIFRLVHENHSATTKKNREWLEKLPIVVFKAEEIMYSKANSEGEYSNSETLWDRVNDAVDTIIRKDENTETGELLPPCVEAALNLGCVPVRASRSQRHNNLRTYLRPTHQECTRSLNENALGSPNNSMLQRQNPDSPCVVWERNQGITRNTNQHIDSLSEKLYATGNENSIASALENTSSNRGSIYPLYYGRSFRPEVSYLHLQESLKPNPVIVGVPIFSPVVEPAEGGCLQNLFPSTQDNIHRKEACKPNSTENCEKQSSHMGFDLSLRLGPFPDAILSKEKAPICRTDGGGNKVSPDKSHDKGKFPLFPVQSAYSHSTSWWNSEGETLNVDVVSRKRKLPVSPDVEIDRFFWSRDSTSNHFAEK